MTGCNALRRTFHGTTNNGEQHNYTEQFLGDCSCIHEMIDGQTYQLSNFNPKASGAWPHPFESQWLGEVKYLQSNMPGSSSQITRFANLAEENYTTYQMFTNLNQATLTPQNDQPTAWYNSGLHLNQTLDGYFWIYTLNPVG